MPVTQVGIMYDPNVLPPETSLRGWIVPTNDDSEIAATANAQATWRCVTVDLRAYVDNADDIDNWLRAQIPGAAPYQLPVPSE